jgi:hypothetical protein
MSLWPVRLGSRGVRANGAAFGLELLRTRASGIRLLILCLAFCLLPTLTPMSDMQNDPTCGGCNHQRSFPQCSQATTHINRHCHPSPFSGPDDPELASFTDLIAQHNLVVCRCGELHKASNDGQGRAHKNCKPQESKSSHGREEKSREPPLPQPQDHAQHQSPKSASVLDELSPLGDDEEPGGNEEDGDDENGDKDEDVPILADADEDSDDDEDADDEEDDANAQDAPESPATECCICSEPVVDPPTTEPCGHSNFCLPCLNQSLSFSSKCPHIDPLVEHSLPCNAELTRVNNVAIQPRRRQKQDDGSSEEAAYIIFEEQISTALLSVDAATLEQEFALLHSTFNSFDSATQQRYRLLSDRGIRAAQQDLELAKTACVNAPDDNDLDQVWHQCRQAHMTAVALAPPLPIVADLPSEPRSSHVAEAVQQAAQSIAAQADNAIDAAQASQAHGQDPPAPASRVQCVGCFELLDSQSDTLNRPSVWPCEHDLMCGPCLQQWLQDELEFTVTPRCPTCHVELYEVQELPWPLADLRVRDDEGDPDTAQYRQAIRRSEHERWARTYKDRASSVPLQFSEPPDPRADRQNSAPPAPLPNDANADAHTLPTLDDVFCGFRTWKFIPQRTVSKWIEACRPALIGYANAHKAGNSTAKTEWLSVFLSLPKQCLSKAHGSTSRKEVNRLNSQVNWLNKQRGEEAAANSSAAVDFASSAIASAEARAPAASQPSNKREEQERSLNNSVARANFLVTRELLSKACQSLTQGKIYKPSLEILELLKALHPPAPADEKIPQCPADAPFIHVDAADLEEVVFKYIAKAQGAGPSQMAGEHILPLFKDAACAEGLACIVSDITNNDLGEHARQLILQSILIALQKPDTDTPRPITIVETLYKCATAYTLQLCKRPPAPQGENNPYARSNFASHVLEEIFGELQLGAGASGGSELAIHVLQAAIEAGGHDFAALLADQANAFNTVSRAKMLQALYDEPRLKFLWKTAAFGYGGKPTSIVYRIDDKLYRIPSLTGSRQGCLLGSLLYCLAVHKDYLAAIDGLPVTARAICDDFSAVGQWKITIEVYDRLKESIGLGPKTAILWWGGGPPPQLVQACKERNIQLKLQSAKALGTVLGVEPKAVGAAALRRAHKKDSLFSAVQHPFMKKQTSALIVTNCLQPCMGFDIRVCVPKYIKEATEYFDSQLVKAADRLLSLAPKKDTDPISPDLTAVLYLVVKPSRFGGMGLRLSTPLRHTAYWSSAAIAAKYTQQFVPVNHPEQVRDLPFLVARYDAHKALVTQGVKSQPDAPGPVAAPNGALLLPRSVSEFAVFYAGINKTRLKLQRALTQTIEASTHRADMRSAPKPDFVRLLDLSGQGASAGLLAVPNSAETTMTDPEYTFTARNRLGMSLDPDCTHCGACGHRFLRAEEQATHFQSCVKFRKTTVNDRHDAVGKTTCTIGRKAGAATNWEKRPDSGSRKRPDGGYHLSDGTFLTDTTVRHPATNTALKVVRPKRGAVLVAAVKGKTKKYKELAKQEGARFVTLAISAFGHFHKDYLIFLKKLSWEAVANYVALSERDRVDFYVQSVRQISVVLHKMNAKIFARGLMESRSHRWLRARAIRGT